MKAEQNSSLEAMMDSLTAPPGKIEPAQSDGPKTELDTLMEGGLFEGHLGALICEPESTIAPSTPTPQSAEAQVTVGALHSEDAKRNSPPSRTIALCFTALIGGCAVAVGLNRVSLAQLVQISPPNTSASSRIPNKPTVKSVTTPSQPVASTIPLAEATQAPNVAPVSVQESVSRSADIKPPIHETLVPITAAHSHESTPAPVPLPSVPPSKNVKVVSARPPVRPAPVPAKVAIGTHDSSDGVKQKQIESSKDAPKAPLAAAAQPITADHPPIASQPTVVTVVGRVKVGDRLATGEVVLDVGPSGELITDMRIIKKEQ